MHRPVATSLGSTYTKVAGSMSPTAYIISAMAKYSPTLDRWTTLDPIRYEAGDANFIGISSIPR